MAYVETLNQIRGILSGFSADVQAPRRLRRMRGRVTAENAPANSGTFRSFEIMPGTSRRGTAVNGTGPKQIVHEMALSVVYQDTGDPRIVDTMETDMNRIRAELENVSNYDFPVSGLQNIQVGASAKIKREGNYLNQIALTVTYFGSY